MRISYIELGGNKYPMCLSLTATEELTERFGDLSNMDKALSSGNIAEIARATNDIIEILMKAGRIYATYMGQDVPPELTCKPGDLIDITDGTAIKAIFETIRTEMGREVETKTKNAGATQGK